MSRSFRNLASAAITFAVMLFLALSSGVQQRPIDVEKPDEKDEELLEATYASQAMRWYNDQRAHPAGKIPKEWRETALAHVRKLNRGVAQTQAIQWSSVGPGNIGGRVRSIIIDPSNPNVILTGSVSGGIWKTTDAGNSWFPLNDFAPNLVIGSIAVHPTNSNIIYAGTGEGFFNIDALAGIGLLKSTDGGASWSVINNFPNPNPDLSYRYITKVALRPDNPNTVFVGMIGGIWRSTDAGSNWSKLSVPPSQTSVSCTDLVLNPVHPDTMFASFGLSLTNGIYRSTNNGTNWTKLTTGLPTTGFWRISLAIAKSNPSIVYASLADTNGYTFGIYKTTNGGNNWFAVGTPLDNTPQVDGTHLGGQGWYNNVIAVDPGNPDVVFAGGINLHKSSNGGTSWTRISHGYGAPYVHVDQHAIAFHPSNSQIVYFGNDGGIARTTDGGASFQTMNNGLAITQFYSGAVDPTQDLFYGGTQDNGTLKSGTLPNWSTIRGGDGGFTAVDFNTPGTIYTEYVFFDFQKSTNGGSSWTRQMTGIPTLSGGGTSDRCGFIAPFTMDPNNPLIIVAGTYRVYRTTNGAVSWTPISTDLTGDGDGSNQVGSSNAYISAIGLAKSSSPTIYVGTSGSATATSRIQVTTNTGGIWTNVTKPPLPDRYVTSIAVDPTNRDIVFVGFSGYNTNTPSQPGHIFRSTNRGTTWVNISNNLPDIPVNAIVIDPVNSANHLLLGTDMGVFETTNGGVNWIEQNNGLAHVSVADLDVRAVDGIVVAATHGRGLYKSGTPLAVEEIPDRSGDQPKEFALLQNYPNPFNPQTTIRFELPSTSLVRLVVYDITGKEVQQLVNEQLTAGSYQARFNGADHASGVYYYTLTVDRTSAGENGEPSTYSETRKMLLVK